MNEQRRALIWFLTAVRWLDTSYNVAYTAVVVSIPRMLYDPLVSSGWRAKTPPLSDFLVTFALIWTDFQLYVCKTDTLYGFFKQHGNIDIKNRITMFSN